MRWGCLHARITMVYTVPMYVHQWWRHRQLVATKFKSFNINNGYHMRRSTYHRNYPFLFHTDVSDLCTSVPVHTYCTIGGEKLLYCISVHTWPHGWCRDLYPSSFPQILVMVFLDAQVQLQVRACACARLRYLMSMWGRPLNTSLRKCNYDDGSLFSIDSTVRPMFCPVERDGESFANGNIFLLGTASHHRYCSVH